MIEFDTPGLISSSLWINFMKYFSFIHPTQTNFHIAKKSPGEYIDLKFKGAAIGMFHHINTYEDDGFLVVDLCAWKG